jgi:hypothetical protein
MPAFAEKLLGSKQTEVLGYSNPGYESNARIFDLQTIGVSSPTINRRNPPQSRRS